MNVPTTDLSSLVAFITERYKYNSAAYPGFDAMTPEARGGFIVKHSVLHMSKSVGALAAEAERQDHGGDMNNVALQVACAKMLVNTLSLASACGMTPEELADMVPKVMTSK